MALIESSVQDGLLLLQFRDPSSRNSFSVRAAEELLGAIESKASGTKGVVLTAVGRVFCSGGNLSDYASMTKADQGKAVNRRITEILQKVSALDRPTICAVNGDCFGGGVELTSAFDWVIATPHSLFGFWQRKIGLSFGWGGGARIEERLGTKRLKQLAISAANLTAHEALDVGLIDAVCPEAILLAEAKAKIESVASLPKAPMASLKRWDSEKETEIFENLWWNEEHQSVLNKRR